MPARGTGGGEIPVGGAFPLVRAGRRVSRRNHVRRTDTRYLEGDCRDNGGVTCSNKSRRSRTPTRPVPSVVSSSHIPCLAPLSSPPLAPAPAPRALPHRLPSSSALSILSLLAATLPRCRPVAPIPLTTHSPPYWPSLRALPVSSGALYFLFPLSLSSTP